MIRFLRVPVASSVQDLGRFGHRASGHARSGAMDPLSLSLTNTAVGALAGSAAVELGPGRCAFEVAAACTLAFGGARRAGADWWQPVRANAGDVFELTPSVDGVWSYVAVAGGIDASIVLGSRAASPREGIGAWLRPGDTLVAGSAHADLHAVEPPPMSGDVRVFGSLPGEWRVSTRADRMGYVLDGSVLPAGAASEWSEPLLPGFVQVPPGGKPIVLMPEGPTVGGYPVPAIAHSEDLRLVAQTKPGGRVRFVSA
jgi:allophanate hydrolase subunit 2